MKGFETSEKHTLDADWLDELTAFEMPLDISPEEQLAVCLPMLGEALLLIQAIRQALSEPGRTPLEQRGRALLLLEKEGLL